MPPAPRLILLRRFATDIETLMAAWTAPQDIARWWAGDGDRVMFVELSPRSGGSFALITQNAAGAEEEERGLFQEIVPNDAIVIAWAKPAGRSLVLQFWPIAGGTELTLTEAPFASIEARDARAATWVAALERLRVLVER